MDVGIFMSSGKRLRLWLIIPPLLMVSVGLGSHAWRQRAQWQFKETQALSDLLPPLITTRKDAAKLFDGLKTAGGGELGSEDQLISFLQDMAQQNEFLVDTINVVNQKKQQQSVPVLNAVLRGRGDFVSIKLYINEVKTEQRLISVSSIKIMQPTDTADKGLYDVEIIFELMLMDEMNAFSGGVR